MICGKGMNSYKTVKSCKGLSHKEARKGRGYYIRMPKSTSVDFVKKCREIEAEELHNSTVKEENVIVKMVKKCLRKV
jgi:hypothetical protein